MIIETFSIAELLGNKKAHVEKQAYCDKDPQLFYKTLRARFPLPEDLLVKIITSSGDADYKAFINRYYSVPRAQRSAKDTECKKLVNKHFHQCYSDMLTARMAATNDVMHFVQDYLAEHLRRIEGDFPEQSAKLINYLADRFEHKLQAAVARVVQTYRATRSSAFMNTTTATTSTTSTTQASSDDDYDPYKPRFAQKSGFR